MVFWSPIIPGFALGITCKEARNFCAFLRGQEAQLPGGMA
jgi:hypothetical protein